MYQTIPEWTSPYDHECAACEDHNTDKLYAKELLQKVVDQLYSKSPIDTDDLEWHLDELCFAIGIQLNPGDLNIQRKYNESFKLAA